MTINELRELLEDYEIEGDHEVYVCTDGIVYLRVAEAGNDTNGRFVIRL